MILRDGLERRQVKGILGGGRRVLLQGPPVPGHDTGRGLERLGRGVHAAYSLAKADHPEHVVADRAAFLAEVVDDARLGFRRGSCRKRRAHADAQVSAPPQLQGELQVFDIA